MKKLTVTIIAAMLCLAATAQAKTHRHALRCHAGYVKRDIRVRERRHHRRVWVRVARCEKARAAKPAPNPATPPPSPASPASPASTISYSTSVDPSFTQAATNPLAVTYAYSASAFANSVNLGATGQLPAGVLNFYSPTTPGGQSGLVCSMNVGGAVAGGNCPVTYAQTGTYNVTTEYIPTAASAVTQTDTEVISPFSTTTTVGSSQSGSTTTYAPSVVDQNGNQVTPSASQVNWIVTDTTTGQTVGNFYGIASAYFKIITDYDYYGHPYGQSVAIFKPGDPNGPTASGDTINPSDSFAVQAVYAPASGGTTTGSTSPAVTLVLSS